MTKPDDIPQDVWDAAWEALHPFVRKGYDMSPMAMTQHLGIARVIMAEREACALVAANFFSGSPFPATSDDIASAIRSRGA